MQSSSSKILLLLLCVLFVSCSKQTDENTRTFLPAINTGVQGANLADSSGSNFLQDLYAPSADSTACQFLESLPAPTNANERFRLLGDWSLTNVSDGSFQISTVMGSVDMGSSPLYQYALLSQAIPDKVEFLALVEQEYAKAASFGDQAKMWAARLLLKLGVLNPYSIRNSAIQSKMDAALPGAFAVQKQKFLFKDSIPGAIFQNGNPGLTVLNSNATDARDSRAAKLQKLTAILNAYARPVKLFSDASWQTFAFEAKSSLSLSLRGLLSKDLRQQSCATVLLHRSFAQLLTVMGYNRSPTNALAGQQRSVLPDVPQMLVSETSQNFAVCPTQGSFLKDGKHVLLSRDDISVGGGSGGSYFYIGSQPYVAGACSRDKAVGFGTNFTAGEGAPGVNASGSAFLAFAEGVANFMVAFNPGAPWWHRPENNIGFPLSPFESMERIKTSGAILPTDAHALALGFLSLSFQTLTDRYLMFVDADNKEVHDTSAAAGVRVSEQDRVASSPGVVQTNIKAAASLLEIALKFSNSLLELSDWKTQAESYLSDELKSEPDARRRSALRTDYQNFIDSMFGDQANLDKVTASGPSSLREQLNDLQLVAAVLAAKFALHTKTGVDCAEDIWTNPQTGEERISGKCTEQEKKDWKYALSLAGQAFHSPLFLKLSR